MSPKHVRDDLVTNDERHSELRPPLPSPEPQTSADETPSGVHRIAVLAQGTAWQTKIQWTVVGAVVMAVGALANWGITKLDLINTAQAQVQAQSSANASEISSVKQQVQTFDAGSRAAIERLERKIDVNNEAQDRKLEAVKQTTDATQRAVMQLVQEMRKR